MEITKEMLIAEFQNQLDFANFVNCKRIAPFRKEFLEYALELIQAPTADVVEVVRCKDCLFANTEDGKIKCHNNYGLLVTEEKNYCSRGRRRAEE